MGKWFDHNSDNNWLEDMRGNLSLVATVVATITFQAVFNPPGNVIQQSILVSSNSTINEEDKNFTGFIESSPLGCFPFKSNDGHNVTRQACPGEAMLASRNPDGFQDFVFCNTMSFIVSLCIALLLVSGVPLKNKLVMWILCIAMCVALTFLAFAYFDALLLITLHKPWFTPTDLAASIAGVTGEGLLLLLCLATLNSPRRFSHTNRNLASAEGHIDIVKELLKVNNKPCLFPNEEGKIPLHYAVIRGRIEVVKELVKAKPDSLSFLDDGNTVFHLCVIHNRLETLKGLVELELAISGKLLYFTSSDGVGNTVLHLAVTSKQVETIRYLLSIPEVTEMASLENEVGLTAYEILKRCPKDFKTLEIQVMLMEYSGTRDAEKNRIHTPSHTSPPVARPRIQKKKKKKRNCLIRLLKWIGGWFKHKGDWVEEMRGNLSLVSTVIATITFQSLVNPPGGFIQQGLSQSSSNIEALNCTILSNNKSYCPGEAVSSFRSQTLFLRYVIYNTISFISSLSVTLLLVSGVPMKNKALIWLLSIGMCITLTTLALAYLVALQIVMPDHIWNDKAASITFSASILAWAGLLVLVLVLITLRFIIWIVKKLVRAIKKLFRCGIRES
ncbi:ankyrin repeat-containing protein ITN1-like [Neltuma alba]|uniref:ankyrin repeat-containing protein ITN1-like n=1 Tax=Neltuma alba TaxID=207710 RepID=UPI0010A41283|nr:ankyrin repeat-containing protein ITN1-like [Prosopis alba]